MFHLRIIRMAVRGLRQNLLRSLLATLGVIIGVGAVVAAVSILQGSQRDMLDSIEALGADQIMIFNGSERRHGRTVGVSSLTPDDAHLILRENENMIIATAPQYQGVGQVKFRARNVNANVLGTTQTYAAMNDYAVREGRFLTREDVGGNRLVCVLGYKVAEDLFGVRSAIGKSVKINGRSFIAVGVMEEKGTLGFFDVDSQVVIPLTTAMGRMYGKRYLTMLVAQCVEADRLPTCIEGVKKTLRASHRIKAGEDDDFMVLTQERFKQQFQQFAVIFAVVFYSIASISMVVGAIGIMNIMLVSVTERTREIGVRIAVGARRLDILKQFLTEAGVISLLGGGLGAIVGWAIGDLLSTVTQVFESYTPPAIILMALTMAVLVGILSGIYPAIRAARLDPVEALRYE